MSRSPIISARFTGGTLTAKEAAAVAAAQPPRSPLTPPEEAAFQAGMTQAQIELQAAQVHPDVFATPEHGPAALLQSFVSEEGAQGRVPVNQASPGADHYEATFDEKDLLGWAWSLRHWWRRWFDKHAWVEPRPEADPVPNKLRIALLGDWGTGLYGAKPCAQDIEKIGPEVIVHLGDVYYAGTEREVEDRFLSVWPQVTGSLSRAVNSNHEMYSGGNAYFRQTLPVFRQRASCFALQNDRWLLIGMDSAYQGNDLEGGRIAAGQLAWLTTLVGQAGQRKVVLFSHHQPFSLFDGQGDKLVADLRALLDAQRISAWYWGHEHRCVVYDPHPAWKLHGRCVGHGGYPYFRHGLAQEPAQTTNADGSRWIRREEANGAPGGIVLDGPNRYVEKHEAEYGPNGYMTIELDGPTLREVVRSPEGAVLHDAPLP